MTIKSQNVYSSEYYWVKCATIVLYSVLLLSCHCNHHGMSWQVKAFCAIKLPCQELWCRPCWRQDLGGGAVRALQGFSFVSCQVLSWAIWMQTDWDWLIERTIIRNDGQNVTCVRYLYINTHIYTYTYIRCTTVIFAVLLVNKNFMER